MTANPDSGATRIDRDDASGRDGAYPGMGDVRRSAAPSMMDERRDRIRWGAVWTGALTTLSTYIVLQLLFFALGWLDLGGDGGTTRALVSAVLALVAFFLGGAAAGASALWHRAHDGMVNAVVAWAITVITLLGFAQRWRPSSPTCATRRRVSTSPAQRRPRGTARAGPRSASGCRWRPVPSAARSARSSGRAATTPPATVTDSAVRIGLPSGLLPRRFRG
jgi:hypothetical protein